MTQHTPTPFYIDADGNLWDSDNCPSIMGKIDLTTDENKATAAFIVEACNGYEALKAQRDELVDMLAKALPFVEEQMTDEGYKSGAVEKYTESIRAILAKVTP